MPRPKACNVHGCSGDIGWQNPMPLSFFRVPAIISETNKKFCGFGQEERQRKVIELSKKRRKAWLKVLKRENATDDQTIKVCARHFISGRPADLEDENNPDWIPCLNLGYKTSRTIDKTKSALRKYEQHKINLKRTEAVKFYGGSSDPPVFVETEEYEEVLVPLTDDDSNPKENAMANLESSIKTNDNINKNSDVPSEIPADDVNINENRENPVEVAADDANNTNNTSPDSNEKYGHWHVHFCTKKACLFSKAAAKCYSIDISDEDD